MGTANAAGVPLVPGEPWQSTPKGVVALNGWANRLFIVCYVGWLTLVALELNRSSTLAAAWINSRFAGFLEPRPRPGVPARFAACRRRSAANLPAAAGRRSATDFQLFAASLTWSPICASSRKGRANLEIGLGVVTPPSMPAFRPQVTRLGRADCPSVSNRAASSRTAQPTYRVTPRDKKRGC